MLLSFLGPRRGVVTFAQTTLLLAGERSQTFTMCPFPQSYTACRDAAKDSPLLTLTSRLAKSSWRTSLKRPLQSKRNDFGSQPSSMRGGRALSHSHSENGGQTPCPSLHYFMTQISAKSQSPHPSTFVLLAIEHRPAREERRHLYPPLPHERGGQKNWSSLSKLAQSTHQSALRGLRLIGPTQSLALPCCRALFAR